MIQLGASLFSLRWFVFAALMLFAPVAWAQKPPTGFMLRGHRAAVLALAFSPDGRFLVSGSADRTLRLWNLQTKRSAYTLSGHSDAVTAVGFTSDGSRIVSGGLDSMLLFWSLDTGKRINSRSTSGPVSSMKISPDGHRIAIGTTDGKLYCADTGVGGGNIIERAHAGRVTQIFWIPDTRRFWSNGDDGQWRVWNMQNGLLKAAKGAAERQGTLESLGNQPVAISPDQRTLAVAKTVMEGGRNSAQLSLLQWPSLQSLISGAANKGHFMPTLHALAFSPDGLTLAGAGDDGTIYCWDVSWLNNLHERQGSAPRVAKLPDEDNWIEELERHPSAVASGAATAPTNPLMGSGADTRWPALTKRPTGGEHHGGTTGLTIINNDTVSVRVAVRLRKAGKTSTEGVDAVLHTDKRRNKEYFVLPEGEYDVFYAKLLEPGIIYQLEKPARIYTYQESLPNGYRIMAHNPEITLTPQVGNVRVLRVK